MSETLNSDNTLSHPFGDQLNYHDSPDIISSIKLEPQDSEVSAIVSTQDGFLSTSKRLGTLTQEVKQEINLGIQTEELNIKTENEEHGNQSSSIGESTILEKSENFVTLPEFEQASDITGTKILNVKSKSSLDMPEKSSSAKSQRKAKKIKCKHCDAKIQRSSFKKHMLRHNEKIDRLKCNECSYQTHFKRDLEKHLLTHNAKTIKCDQCSFKTKARVNLLKHMRRHKKLEEGVAFKCNECKYQTHWKDYLIRHVVIHKDPHDVKIFKCEQCEYKTKFRSDLRKHMFRHETPSASLFKCDKCSYQTFHGKDMRKHVIVHKEPDEVYMTKCDQCDFQTKHKSYIHKHMRRHMEIKDSDLLKCNDCDYQTTEKV